MPEDGDTILSHLPNNNQAPTAASNVSEGAAGASVQLARRTISLRNNLRICKSCFFKDCCSSRNQGVALYNINPIICPNTQNCLSFQSNSTPTKTSNCYINRTCIPTVPANINFLPHPFAKFIDALLTDRRLQL